jgi:hypothetical protein
VGYPGCIYLLSEKHFWAIVFDRCLGSGGVGRIAALPLEQKDESVNRSMEETKHEYTGIALVHTSVLDYLLQVLKSFSIDRVDLLDLHALDSNTLDQPSEYT